jgi:hypothetical protein
MLSGFQELEQGQENELGSKYNDLPFEKEFGMENEEHLEGFADLDQLLTDQ